MDLNKEMASEFNGWTLQVPNIVETIDSTEKLFLVLEAQGVKFEELSDALRQEVGPIIAECQLRMLFRKGWFNPDPHTGNFLIDPKTKIIYPMDFGQTIKFTKHFLLEGTLEPFVRFIKAIGEKNIDQTIAASIKISKDGNISISQRQQLRDDLRSIYDSNNPADLKKIIIDIITALAEDGLPLQDKYLWTIKGLMILYGEKYVSPEEFGNAVQREITRQVRTNPRLLLNEVLPSCIHLFQ